MATHSDTPPSLDEIVKAWQEHGIRTVLFEFPDLHGMSRSKIIPVGAVLDYAQTGLNMYGGTVTADTASNILPGTLYNEERNYADQLLKPDLATASPVPWMNKTARLICDACWDDGTPLEAAPRRVLRRVLEELEKLGFLAQVGLELEFYLLDRVSRRPAFDDLHIFNTQHNVAVPVIERILEAMPQIGIDIITANAEYGQGQFEINYRQQIGLSTADQGFTFKNGVKLIAQQQGYLATFMTKPRSDQSASGGHIHISLLRKEEGGQNAFLDGEDPRGLSRTAYHFIQGMLKHARGAMALMAPTVNCYKRYVRHHFAPTNISWGIEDRSAMVRVKNSRDQRTRLENRLPSAISNPYLAIAAVVASGLLGLRDEQMPPEIARGTADSQPFAPLPATLEEALRALEENETLGTLLGPEFVHIFTVVKRAELDRFHAHVTEWERDEYLEAF